MDLTNLRSKFTTEWQKVDVGRTLLLILLILALFSAGWQYLMPRVVTLTSKEFVRVPQIQRVTSIKRIAVPGPERVVTIEKEKIVEKLVLPPDVAADPNKQVIATGETPPSEAGFELATVMDWVTGESVEVVKEKELPFFEFTKRLELGAYYGLSTAAAQIGQLETRYQFMRTGPVKWDLKGEVNSRPELKALVGFHIDLIK